MKLQSFEARSEIQASAEALFDWHARPGALARLIPPWGGAEVLDSDAEGIEEGSRVTLRVGRGPFKANWVARHRNVEPGRSFQDIQERGPFAGWCHTHRCEPRGADASSLRDSIEYALPLGAIGRFAGGRLVRGTLRRMFTYRHALTALDLERQRRFADLPRLEVAVAGSSGLIGRALVAFLQTAGHRVRRLVRRRPARGEVRWDPAAGEIDRDGLSGVDAVLNLAGENIASGRWNERRKTAIRESRVQGTRLLAETIASLPEPPEVLVNASAIGFYGDRGDEELTESSPPGSDFLAETCKAWEGATRPAEDRGIRVVRPRIGVVLTSAGGALSSMLPLFNLGLGGRVGHGRQYMSWIGLEDLVGVLHTALLDRALEGPVNATAPRPVRNAEFTRSLARVLRRPAILPASSTAIRLALGEMGQALLLGGARVIPGRLERIGFRFAHPDLESALRFALGRFGKEHPGPEFSFGRSS